MRMCLYIGKLMLAYVFVIGLSPASAQAQQGPAEKLKSIETAVAGSVSNELVRQFAFCHLRAAWWGRYDMSVRVGKSATQDGQPHILQMTKGEFSQKVDPDTSVDLAQVDGKGNVVFANKEEAFARGVPFFITDATVSPTEVGYTVHSNPAFPVERAVFMIESRYESLNDMTLEVTRPLSSKAEPQARTFKLSSPLDPQGKHRFGIAAQLPSGHGCLVSNTIDLNALLKTEPAK